MPLQQEFSCWVQGSQDILAGTLNLVWHTTTQNMTKHNIKAKPNNRTASNGCKLYSRGVRIKASRAGVQHVSDQAAIEAGAADKAGVLENQL